MTDYLKCSVYLVTQRLLGKDVVLDQYAEHHPCEGCEAPAGYRCRGDGDVRVNCRDLGEKRIGAIQWLQAAEWQRLNPVQAERFTRMAEREREHLKNR